MISFAFLISVFFNRAKVAGIVGPILVFACVMPRFAFFTTDASMIIIHLSMYSQCVDTICDDGTR
jgi:hypothetical protein